MDLNEKKNQLFIARDGGFTSAGVAVALLLTVTLLFSAAQVRWVQSQSADIQFVADAGALAGANVVGEFIIVVRIADAVILSLSLLGMSTFGLAIVVSCIPGMQQVGAELMQFGVKIFQTRDKCAKTAAASLNKLQAALPFLIAANAASAIEANRDISGTQSSYHGIAIPLPLQGEDIGFPIDDTAEESADALSNQNEETSEHTDSAQQAYKKMEQLKHEAYLADCGNNPNYCMYERAGHLASLSGSQNPYYSSEETWLFDYAYKRAEHYYAKRLAGEAPANQSLDEQVRSFCRERFYTYAVEELSRGWCTTSLDGVLDANFPLFPKNTSELRQTRLYTESVYPLSADGALHGSPACSAYQSAGSGGTGSVAGLEAGTHSSCGTCGFAASTIGKVAAASSSIDNGFEYHYRIVALAAKDYQEASKEYERETKQAKESAQTSFDILEEALQTLKTQRLTPRPPGHNGVIAIVFDAEAHVIPAGFSNPSVTSSATLQPRMALSAAALAEQEADDGANLLASFTDRAVAELEESQNSLALSALGAFDGVLDIWGSALLAYSRGGDAISEGIAGLLNAIPLVKDTPLSRWAQSRLSETVEAFGLQGANLNTPRPVIINSIHVLRASESAAAQALLYAKESYASLAGSSSGTISSALVDGLTGELSQRGSELLSSEFVLYEISFGSSDLPSIPITLRLPSGVVEQGQSVLDKVLGTINSGLGGGGSGALWE